MPSSCDQWFLPRSYHLSISWPAWSKKGRISTAARAMNVLAPKLFWMPLTMLIVESTSYTGTNPCLLLSFSAGKQGGAISSQRYKSMQDA